MTNPTELTTESAALLAEMLNEGRGNGFYEETGGCFMMPGDLTKAQRGNLTDLKVKGLIGTVEDDRGFWVIFSEAAMNSTAGGREWLRHYGHGVPSWVWAASNLAGFTGTAPEPGA